MSQKPARLDPVATLRAEIAALPAKKGSRGTVVNVDFRSGAYGALIDAAKRRRMSVPAYVRRAAYAMAAHDLGIPLVDLLQHDPRAATDKMLPIVDPEGVKFGPWEIAALAGEGAGDVEPPRTA